jgi:catechol 2,3-dioxygenase-like lactoylglutathione lyase family enzyme
MAIRVLAMHHHAVAAGATPEELTASRSFYGGLLGLENDAGRPEFGIDGNWYFVGPEGRSQLHLVGLANAGTAGTAGPEAPPNPLETHVAFAVESLEDARLELAELQIPFLFLPGAQATGTDQIFLRDPAGHMVELHEQGKCRCDRQEISE